ncbi:MAG: DNA-processing protein DprA, partial [Bdellovibrionales bacterium]|nr:DNA-processing protein DprA [Bdellovibrionales bacterium]
MEVKEFNNRNKVSSISNEEISSYLKRTNANLLSSNKVDLLIKHKTQYPELFYKGDNSLLKIPIVSVVGTRTPTISGIKRTEKTVEVLCENNFVVMSGLAKGVDTAAHEKTLQLNGKTIAVLGTPIHKIYPAKNKKLANTISERGLLLSSTPPKKEVGKHLFPRRNRLMAILSKATVITEAG